MQMKKAKVMAVQDPSQQSENQGSSEPYSPHHVVAKMLMRKERKIPGSVFKPHNEEIVLLQSVALGQPQPSARVFFPYPKYCHKDEAKGTEKGKDLLVVGDTSAGKKQGQSFLMTSNWAAKPELKSFQKV